MAMLRVISGPAAGASLEIEQEVTIGREGTDLEIPDPELSRRHVALRVVDGGVEVEDLGSRNGTFVNDRQITGPETLATGASVRVGASEIAIEAAAAPAVDPDVTKARAVVQEGPEVTKARAVVQEGPEVTKARAVVPDDPDVTKVRPTAAGPGQTPSEPAPPDATAVRPTAPPPTGPGPGATAGRPIPPPPAGHEAPEPDGGGGRRSLLLAAVIGLLVAAAVIALLLLT